MVCLIVMFGCLIRFWNAVDLIEQVWMAQPINDGLIKTFGWIQIFNQLQFFNCVKKVIFIYI